MRASTAVAGGRPRAPGARPRAGAAASLPPRRARGRRGWGQATPLIGWPPPSRRRSVHPIGQPWRGSVGRRLIPGGGPHPTPPPPPPRLPLARGGVGLSLTNQPGATATHPACIEGAVSRWPHHVEKLGPWDWNVCIGGAGRPSDRNRGWGGGGAAPTAPRRCLPRAVVSSTELSRAGAPTPQPSLCDARPPAGPAPVLHPDVSYAYCLTPIPYVWPPVGARHRLGHTRECVPHCRGARGVARRLG